MQGYAISTKGRIRNTPSFSSIGRTHGAKLPQLNYPRQPLPRDRPSYTQKQSKSSKKSLKSRQPHLTKICISYDNKSLSFQLLSLENVTQKWTNDIVSPFISTYLINFYIVVLIPFFLHGFLLMSPIILVRIVTFLLVIFNSSLNINDISNISSITYAIKYY